MGDLRTEMTIKNTTGHKKPKHFGLPVSPLNHKANTNSLFFFVFLLFYFVYLFSLKSPQSGSALQFSKAASLHTKLTGLEQPKATPPPAWIRGSLILSCLTSSQTEYAEKLLKVSMTCFSITIHLG